MHPTTPNKINQGGPSAPTDHETSITTKNVSDYIETESHASGKIFIGCIRLEISRGTLYEALNCFGRIKDLRLVNGLTKKGHPKRFAFCEFESPTAPVAVIDGLQGNKTLGYPALYVAPYTRQHLSHRHCAHHHLSHMAMHATTLGNENTETLRGAGLYAYPPPPGLLPPSHHPLSLPLPSPPSAPGTPYPHPLQLPFTGQLPFTPLPPYHGLPYPFPFEYPMGCPVLPTHNNVPQHDRSHQASIQHSSAEAEEEDGDDGAHGDALNALHSTHGVFKTNDVHHHSHHQYQLIQQLEQKGQENQCSTLYIRGLPLDMDEVGLYYMYLPFGAIVATKILRNMDFAYTSRGAGFVEFCSKGDADTAFRATHRCVGPGGGYLLVRYADRPLHTSFAAAAWAMGSFNEHYNAAINATNIGGDIVPSETQISSENQKFLGKEYEDMIRDKDHREHLGLTPPSSSCDHTRRHSQAFSDNSCVLPLAVPVCPTAGSRNGRPVVVNYHAWREGVTNEGPTGAPRTTSRTSSCQILESADEPRSGNKRPELRGKKNNNTNNSRKCAVMHPQQEKQQQEHSPVDFHTSSKAVTLPVVLSSSQKQAICNRVKTASLSVFTQHWKNRKNNENDEINCGAQGRNISHVGIASHSLLPHHSNSPSAVIDGNNKEDTRG